MSALSPPAAAGTARSNDLRLWSAYAGLCIICWMLYSIAGTEWLRGSFRLWDAMYEATWNLVPPMLLGLLAWPWTRWLQRRLLPAPGRALAHVGAALVFAALWEAVDYGLAWWLFGAEHAQATFVQHVLWRSAWAAIVYTALVLGFGGVLHGRRAHRAALGAAQAEAALVRAELAAISGKLNPHFLFNTLNSLVFLVRSDPAVAEASLLCFSRMMRYLLDTQRGPGRVRLGDELDFVRDFLELESLRLGPRLRVDWRIDASTLDDEIPPLTLQPLVENSVVHGIAPRIEGGTIRIEAEALTQPPTLALRVSDDGEGCDWPATARAGRREGVGLATLRRRFELDYEGHARLVVRSARGAGFRAEVLIPRSAP